MACEGYCRSSAPGEPDPLRNAYAEIERLHAANRRALAIADERSRENVGLRDRLERYDIAVSRESREDLFGGEELAAANKLGGAICDYIERCRTGLQIDGGIRAGVDSIIRKEALPWLSQRPKIIAAHAVEQNASGSVDRGNALLKAQEEARTADGRPAEDIIRAQRDAK